MSRLGSTIRNDVIIQVRKNFYSVALIIAVLVAVTTSFAFKAEHIRIVIPAAMLLLVGGTTLVFIGGLIMEEKDKGILKAVLLSPLRIGEYLWAKIISLTFLATLEVGIMVGGPLAYFHARQGILLPNIWILTTGIIVLNLIYTLLGIVITVRFRKVTDYLIPVMVIMIFFQIPILRFLGIINNPLLLAIPTTAPVMIIQGAFIPLGPVFWTYALTYTGIQLLTLSFWSHKAYRKHIVEKMS